MNELLSNLLLVLTWCLIASGLIGMFRYKTSWGKTLNVAHLDSISVVTLVLAMVLRTGFNSLTPKLLLLLLFYWLTNPVSNQLTAYSLKQENSQKGGLNS